MAYTEGIAFGLSVTAAWLAWRQRFVWAGVVAAFGVLVRPTGVLILLPVLLLAWAAGADGRWRRVITAAIPTAVIGLAPPPLMIGTREMPSTTAPGTTETTMSKVMTKFASRKFTN